MSTLISLRELPLLNQGVANHIAQVDANAAANSRRRVTYLGAVTDLAAELAGGGFDMLLVYTQWNFDANYASVPEVFTADDQALIATALGSGALKKLAVW